MKPKATKKKKEPKVELNAMGVPKKVPPPEPVYTMTVTIGDVTLTGQGNSALKALEALQKPAKITTKVFVSLSDGERRVDKLFMPGPAKRLFYPQAQYIQARNLLFLLK